MNDVLVVVVTQTSRQLLIVHLGLVFADAPSSCHLIRVRELELPAVTCPRDEVLTRLVRQLLQQELPQLDWSTPCADRQQSTSIQLSVHTDNSQHQYSCLCRQTTVNINTAVCADRQQSTSIQLSVHREYSHHQYSCLCTQNTITINTAVCAHRIHSPSIQLSVHTEYNHHQYRSMQSTMKCRHTQRMREQCLTQRLKEYRLTQRMRE